MEYAQQCNWCNWEGTREILDSCPECNETEYLMDLPELEMVWSDKLYLWNVRVKWKSTVRTMGRDVRLLQWNVLACKLRFNQTTNQNAWVESQRMKTNKQLTQKEFDVALDLKIAMNCLMQENTLGTKEYLQAAIKKLHTWKTVGTKGFFQAGKSSATCQVFKMCLRTHIFYQFSLTNNQK